MNLPPNIDKGQLLEYLQTYLTPQRMSLFDKVVANRTRHFTIVAEDTYQEHNASALVRTCDCFGIQDLYIIEEYNRYRLAKGMAQGAEKWIDLHFYSEHKDNIQACIDDLRSNGYAIVATTPHEKESILEEYDVTRRSAFFLGQEKKGLSPQILEQADAFVRIPMFGFTESFNVSVSAALLLQSIVRRMRENPGINWQLSEKEILDLKIDWCLRSIKNSHMIVERYFDGMKKDGSKS